MTRSRKKIQALRSEYTQDQLTEDKVDSDPLKLFSRWFDDAVKSNHPEPNAMILATADGDGRPSVRTVLLKSYDEQGLVFFTNYDSRKGRELQQNPRASLLFYWGELQRQVRMEGKVDRISRKASADYFASRPLESRLGAWSSPQSAVIESRDFLAANFEKVKSRYADGDVPLPDFWGGYVLKPEIIEFWQGRKNRLHDRLRYQQKSGKWVIDRLAP